MLGPGEGPTRFVGIDGCSAGWIAITWDGESATTAHFLPTLADLADAVTGAVAIAIDIPIVVPETQRAAEAGLRTFLGPRRSSVFATPPRVAMAETDYAAANAASRAATGKGISRQAWGLVPKIRELQAWLPTAPAVVIEAHPEACFAMLLGHPATASKKTWAGMTERFGVLTDAGLDLTELDDTAGRSAATDDVLDAAAAAWTAARFHRGEARSFPENADGSADTIWA